jgi:rhodanese-related sulfurtransferase
MKKSDSSIITLFLVMALLLPGFSYSANVPASVSQLVANAKKAIKTVNMAEFKTMYDKKDVGLLIDVRDPNEYAAGHIPGAVNVSRGTLEFKLWKQVGGHEKPDLNRKMMLYCGSGGRCALATKSLMDLGFTNVTAISMKLSDWKKAGYPFEAMK